MFFSENEQLYESAFCQRFPPVLIEGYEKTYKDETEHWLQPVVKVSGWCGEFKAIKRHSV